MSETKVSGTILGFDGKMQQIRVGDYVQHLVKQGFGLGIVTEGGLFYKGEAACKVDFENEPNWTARLSKLQVVEPPKPTVENFGFKVGDKVWHRKYHFVGTITSKETGEYKGEPCCYVGCGRPTRFSQIEPYNGQDKPVLKAAAPVAPVKASQKLTITLPNGKIITIDIE